MNKKDLFFYFMIIVVVGLCIYLIWFTKTDGYNCILEPLVYGVNHLSSSNNQSIICTCTSAGSSEMIIVTKDNLTITSYNNLLNFK